MTEDLRLFVEARYGDLLRTAFLLTGSTEAAEDLVQDALVRAMRHWDAIDDPMPYLNRIMINKRTNIWRRITSRELPGGIVPDAVGERQRLVSPDQANGVADRDELLAALATLGPRMRAVVVLRYWLDLPESEVAGMLGCSVGTVKSQAARGLGRLRSALPTNDLPAKPARMP